MNDTLMAVVDSVSVLVARTDVRIGIWLGFVGIVGAIVGYICEKYLERK